MTHRASSVLELEKARIRDESARSIYRDEELVINYFQSSTNIF
jgi:hypothetical protein